MHEYVGNMHMHTPYSDGEAYHTDIAKAARTAGLDFIIVTDHNLYVTGVEGYYGDAESDYVLLLTGEEIHDRERLPQVNHLLVYNAGQELVQHAADPQRLIDAVNAAGGLCFLAHPSDKDVPMLPPDGDAIRIPWVDWQVTGYTGLEVWNYMACWKDTLASLRVAYQALFRPEDAVIGPRVETLARWDALLAEGQRVVGIGNSDAHGSILDFGVFKHTLFPYDFLFHCVNTHIFTPTALSGDVAFDADMIYAALAAGRAFVSYDLIGDAHGFRFSAQGGEGGVEMGGDIRLGAGVTLQAKPPERAHVKIIRHGEVVWEDERADAVVYTAREPGAYRVEVWREYRGKLRCWILSNPIYILG